MAGPFAPTDWQVSDCVVLRQQRGWGADVGRQSLVQLTFHSNGVSLAGLTYPSGGMPFPPPTQKGLREGVKWAFPLGPWTSVSNLANMYPVVVVPAPTGTPTEPWRMRLGGQRPTAYSGAVTTAEFTTGGVTLIAPTTNTSGIRCYLIVQGK